MTGELISTLESPSEFDVLTSLRLGEPYFVLVGRDRLAPDRVREWADQNRRRALAEFEEGKIGRDLRDRECRKSTEAEMIAESMREYKNNWAQSHATEHPVIVTYSGHKLPAETLQRDRIRSARIRAGSAVHNAIAAIAELEEIMGEDAAHDELLTHLALGDLKDIAFRVEPPRPALQAPAPLLEAAESQEEESEDGNEE